MRYLIFGSGAVGSYLGVRLASSGQQVSFLCREYQLQCLLERGFRLSADGPTLHLPQPSVYTDVSRAFAREKPEMVLLTVKAFDVTAAAKSLAPLLDNTTTVVSFLNGVNNEATLAGEIGPVRVLPATLTTAVQMLEPGLIQVERVRGIGLGGNHPRTGRLKQDFEAAGLLVHRYRDPERMKWSKLLTNIVSNASSAILGWSAQEIYDHRITAQLEIRALREAVRVMRRVGYAPHNLPGVPVSVLARAVFLPVVLTRRVLGRIVSRGRGEKKPSLHYDIGRGRSEIRWLNGAVVEYGLKTGIATPVNKLLTETLLDLVHKRRAPTEFSNSPETLLQLLSE